MDEPMTPMERRVVEYHVWKTQYYKPKYKPKLSFGGFTLLNNLLNTYGSDFLRFKRVMTSVQMQEFNSAAAKAWQEMNLLDLAKALGEYEADCPDLSGLGIPSEKNSDSRHPH